MPAIRRACVFVRGRSEAEHVNCCHRRGPRSGIRFALLRGRLIAGWANLVLSSGGIGPIHRAAICCRVIGFGVGRRGRLSWAVLPSVSSSLCEPLETATGSGSRDLILGVSLLPLLGSLKDGALGSDTSAKHDLEALTGQQFAKIHKAIMRTLINLFFYLWQDNHPFSDFILKRVIEITLLKTKAASGLRRWGR